MRRIFSSEAAAGWFFLLPSVVVIVGLMVYPVFFDFSLSLKDINLIRPDAAKYVGLQQYAELLADSDYWSSIKTGLVWTGLSVLGQVIIGLGMALLINQRFKGRSLVRSLLIIPWVIPTAVVAITWRWMFNDIYGIINHLLVQAGLLSAPITWLGNERLAMFSVIMVNLWRGFPLVMLLIFARLQTIPDEQYAAAHVDGASKLQAFLYVTLPNLKNVLFITILLRTIWVFNFFDLVWLLTQGGPLDATMIPPIFVYMKMFGMLRLGEAAAISITMVIILLILATSYVYVLRRSET